jgi:superfamily II DNA/RNA helicase
MQAIPIMLRNREILGCAPTGSGKTCAFLVPLLTQLKVCILRSIVVAAAELLLMWWVLGVLGVRVLTKRAFAP